MEHSFVLQMQGIKKVFPGIRALDNVVLEVRRGDIHAICGENGAGKSTLMKVLSGVYPHGSHEGRIIYMGKEMAFKNINESENAGIVIIHQELTMIPELSSTENIFMGNEVVKHDLIDWDTARQLTVNLLTRVGLIVNPDTLIKNLGVGQQQLVEIAKALSKNVKLLILDEPTSALNEIAAISDAVTVIRDGQTVDTYAVEAGYVDEDRIIRSMVGRSIENRYPVHESHPGEVIFEVAD